MAARVIGAWSVSEDHMKEMTAAAAAEDISIDEWLTRRFQLQVVFHPTTMHDINPSLEKE